MPNQRDIVLVPIPFTDLTSNRRRPVVVVSNNEYNRRGDDIVVVAMTSNLKRADYSFTITSTDLALGSLKRPSRIRVDKIYTLAQSIVVKRFGQLGEDAFNKIRQMLTTLVGDDRDHTTRP
ncbi:type II toxin-antitoxin system PemK/MazF family toxin [Candidatus Bipolaricaulota bacterium]|nr:type II toxin-antitoxin system PemK/MazF family toxin [Candidatus Bipolaricaulota bacterium]